jgi:shikimate kinase
MTIVLCGLPGCGKTTIGKEVAEKLCIKFIDTDRLIEDTFHNQFSCRQLFSTIGEKAFRALERKFIEGISIQDPCVISLGGGSFDVSPNIFTVQRLGTIIYLKASPDILFPRISQLGIPPYVDRENPRTSFLTLAKRRIPLYEKASTITIDTDSLSIEAIVQHIVERRF